MRKAYLRAQHGDEGAKAQAAAEQERRGWCTLGELTKVLEQHVIAGKVTAADITSGPTATTLEDSTVKFTVKDDKVYMNGMLVTTADVAFSNGVIHVINKVLVPKQRAALAGDLPPARAGATDLGSKEAPSLRRRGLCLCR